MIQLAPDTMTALQIAFGVGTPVATVMGAYYVLKFGLNGARKDIKGTREDVTKIKQSVNDLKEGQTEVRVKMAEIATRMEDTRSWVGTIDQDLKRHIEMDV